MLRILNLILYLTLVRFSFQNRNTVQEKQVHLLTHNNADIVCLSEEINVKIPSIYCYNGKKKEISSLWETVSISLDINNDQFEQFEGRSPAEVLEKFKLHESSWTANIFSFSKRKHIKLDPFNKTCIGILTLRSYRIKLIVNNVDRFQLMKFTIGLILFLYAETLSKNQIFYYICGITFGICGSVVILIYLISRIFPNKPLMYGFAVGGWTMSYYFVQYLLDNARLIALQYMQYVLMYIAVSGLISFAICYRFGPMTNPRSRTLIQWFLQMLGLALIFYSSYLYEITYAIDFILLFSRILPFKFIFSAFRFMKNKMFRPKVKLLTRKEYIDQGRVETKKALEELRGYCSSPECKPWKTVLKLKNPTRFAQFVEGSSHVSEDEIEDYDSLSLKPNGTIITDDSDSVGEYTEED